MLALLKYTLSCQYFIQWRSQQTTLQVHTTVSLTCTQDSHNTLAVRCDSQLRKQLCEAVENEGKVTVPGASEPSLINLDEAWPALKQISFTENSFWKKLPAEKLEWLKEYTSLAESLCQLGDFVFRQLEAFAHLPSLERSPTKVQEWHTTLLARLKSWLRGPEAEGLLKHFEQVFLGPCQSHLKKLFSSGLDSVAQTVKQCLSGQTGGGLSQEMQQQVLLQIPTEHPLRALSCSFLQAPWCF